MDTENSSMKQKVLDELKKYGIDNEYLFERQIEGFDSIIFFDMTDDDVLMKCTFLFLEKIQRIQVDIATKTEGANELDLLRRVNDLNIEYSGRTFFVLGDEMFMRSQTSYSQSASNVINFARAMLDTAENTIAKKN